MRRWIKFHLRKHIPPIDREHALTQKRRLALVYAFCAWNSCAIVAYMLLKQSFPMSEAEEKEPVIWVLRLMGVKEVNRVCYDGFKLKSEINYEDIHKGILKEEEK